jgi:hypothetical protein
MVLESPAPEGHPKESLGGNSALRTVPPPVLPQKLSQGTSRLLTSENVGESLHHVCA